MKITKEDIGREVVSRNGAIFTITEVDSRSVTIENKIYGSILLSEHGRFYPDPVDTVYDIVRFCYHKNTEWKTRALKAEKELAALKEKIKGLL